MVRLVKQFGPLLFLLALMLAFAVTNDSFLTQLNLFNVARPPFTPGALVVTIAARGLAPESIDDLI